MRLLVCLLLTMTATPALAIECSQGKNVENFRSVSEQKNGDLLVGFGESNFTIPKKDIAILEGSSVEDAAKKETKVLIANKANVKTSAEGEETNTVISMVFAYSHKTRQGRLTLVTDGFSVANNELIASCK